MKARAPDKTQARAGLESSPSVAPVNNVKAGLAFRWEGGKKGRRLGLLAKANLFRNIVPQKPDALVVLSKSLRG